METIEKTQKLEEKELKTLQELNARYGKLKIMLGELELRKADVIEEVKDIKQLFVLEEKKLIDKYGSDTVVNLQTGEITTKKENG
tara:strand:- start:8956 stop:9210 length:255 start_codon:yes stop_codon:yes gene_type:complete